MVERCREDRATTSAVADVTDDTLPPLGPESLTWNTFGDWRTSLLIAWAATLQAMHPVINAALIEHSNVFDDEVIRLARSAGPIVQALYDPSGAEARRIRVLHRNIKGTTSSGNRYHALHPEVFYWAHATFFAMPIVAAEYFGEPFSPADREQLYRESRQWFALYGMPLTKVPDTYEDFERYWETTVREVLEHSETVRRSRILNGLPLPRPDERIPQPLWRFASPLVARLAVWIANGTMPPAARQRLGWNWSARDERRLRLVGRLVREGFRLIPARWRLVPSARRAVYGESTFGNGTRARAGR